MAQKSFRSCFCADRVAASTAASAILPTRCAFSDHSRSWDTDAVVTPFVLDRLKAAMKSSFLSHQQATHRRLPSLDMLRLLFDSGWRPERHTGNFPLEL